MADMNTEMPQTGKDDQKKHNTQHNKSPQPDSNTQQGPQKAKTPDADDGRGQQKNDKRSGADDMPDPEEGNE